MALYDKIDLESMVANSGIFDLEYYLDQLDQDMMSHSEAISHFVREGYVAGLKPSLAVDFSAYLRINPDVAATGADPLEHFLFHGLREGRAANDQQFLDLVSGIELSGEFDLNYYNDRAGTNIRTLRRAIAHYMEEDQSRRISPSPTFDRAYYARKYHDVVAAGWDPFVHYAIFGRDEGRRPKLSRWSSRSEMPKAPSEQDWQRLAEAGRAQSSLADEDVADVVDVIIPVYRGIDDTLACIYSVLLSKNTTPYRLIVINDCSPDLDLARELRVIADKGLIILYENKENLGFVSTANRGISLSQKRDVLLLNADTIVYNDWLDRLRSCAYSTPTIATVTPFSNNATIFSYPYTEESNHQDLELAFDELDLIAARVNAGMSVRVPTGVGFCFYIRRAAVDQIGLFDIDLFRKGYGEENDFCMRAIEHGWENAGALDVFVRHTGEVSFGKNASESKRQGYERLILAHPGYESRVHDIIRRDVFRDGRARLDVGRFASASAGSGILMIEHGWGGGIERHIDDLSDLLSDCGTPVLVAKPSLERSIFQLGMLKNDDFPNLPSIDWWSNEAVVLLRDLSLRAVHIHSLVGMDLRLVEQMLAVISNANLPYYFTVHDYAPVCPRINMIDWSGSYCDSLSEDYCTMCITKAGTMFGQLDIKEWRATYRRVIDGAEIVMVPHVDVAERLRNQLATVRPILVREHPYRSSGLAPSIALKKSVDTIVNRRRIGIIGSIGPHKGSRLLEHLCADAIERNLDLDYVVYGHTDFDERSHLLSNLKITGRYKESELADIFMHNPSDIFLYISVWPETYCYTLDFAFELGVHPVSFDFGAPARRIKDCNFGSILPASAIYNPSLINNHLLEVDLSDRTPRRENGREWKGVEHYYQLDTSKNRLSAATCLGRAEQAFYGL